MRTARKIWLVIRYEFWRHVTRRGFLIGVFGLPLLFLLLMGGLSLFAERKADDPVGIVDRAGVARPPGALTAVPPLTTPIQPYRDEAAARQALDDGAIQAYLLIPADYLDGAQLTLYHRGETYDGLQGELRRYLRASLLAEAGVDPAVQRRLNGEPSVAFVSLVEEDESFSFLSLLLPFLLGFIFLIAIFSSAGYLIQAVVDEKENRTMEILITSLTPEGLMAGKIIGLVGVGLVQIGAWLGLAAAGLFLIRYLIPDLPFLAIPPDVIVLALLWFLPFYLLVAALMTAIGVSVTDVSEGQQLVSVVSMLSMFPLYFTFLVLDSPDSPLSLTLSFIPFSAPITILSRTQVTAVPLWQLALSWTILAAAALLALWLVGRLLRSGMLRYGQKLSFREMGRLLIKRGGQR